MPQRTPSKDETETATLLFCRSTGDGSISPNWDTSREEELQGHFEIGITVADRYLLQRRLGDGAMGRVFQAKDLRLDRPVAMKVVSHRKDPEDTDDLEAVLQREARLGASLNHRGIAAVYDYGFHDNKSYTIFEFVEGETLRKLLQRRHRLPLDETLQVVTDLSTALDFAHARGVIHRDLKPENICFTKAGELKILDLGIAFDTTRDVETSAYSGTPAYSSPEQAECRPTDGKSDQYALGLIVFEMLTGRQAFPDNEPLRLLKRQVTESPPSPREALPDLPDAADRAIARALSKDPNDRFANCQEFARHLGDPSSISTGRHSVQTPAENRIAFYLGHVAEESLLARELSEELRLRKYSCWLYGRDAIAGVPFIQQAEAAIERARAVVLLVSRPAIRSSDLAREIDHAHQVGCPILPLLIDMSREEFEKLAPSWCRLLGMSPVIEYRRSKGLHEILDRLSASADSLRIAADQPGHSPPREPASHHSGQIWATDANQIDIQDIEQVLFRNDIINDFLNRKHRYFVSATKGFGKTLLLTCKRQILTQASTSSDRPVKMIPEGRPYLDFMSELRSLSTRYERPLADLSVCKRLWSAALRISAISHFPAVIDDSELMEVEDFPKRIQRWLRGAKIQPTVVFKELTALHVSELNRLIDQTENFLDQQVRRIHGGLCFFVDKVDQAIRHLTREAWVAIQAGLIEAAWETMNANSHLKIYATIRQEAFTNYESDIKANLFAATTNLNYSEEELAALIEQLSRCYEGGRSFEEFLGLNVVRHGLRATPEDSYQYVRRHTCGRPRDIVALASAISSQRSSLSEKRLREVVQQTSSSVVVSNIFDEVRVFLNCLHEREARLRFLALIPSNILEKSDAIRVCEEFNGLAVGSLQHFGEDSSQIFHPFRDLYAAGMLGTIEFDTEQGISIQRFRRPHDSLTDTALLLPDSPVYLIHPALQAFIQSHRTRGRFLQFQHVAVGDGLVWEPYYRQVLTAERPLHEIKDRSFVDLAHQTLKRVQSLLSSGNAPFGRAEITATNEWRALGSHQDEDAKVEAVLGLEELLKEL